MKRVIKVILVVSALVVLGVGGFVGYCALDFPVRHPTQKVDLKVEVTPERVARGKQISSMLCSGCHYDQNTGALTGRKVVDIPAELGVFYSRNITRHPERGVGGWTDGELAFILRTGIERDGIFPGPFMAHPHASDEDILSIIAFLRSDDPLVRPMDTPRRLSEPSLLAKILVHTVFQPFPYPTQKITAPDPKDKVAYGRYLTDALYDCYACHSADFKTMDVKHPEKSKGYFGGGNPVTDADGRVVPTANLTFDTETGIGSWSEAQFKRAVREGFRPDNRPLRYPMTPMSELSDDDVSAIYAYLKTVPVIRNPIQRWTGADQAPASASVGEKVYHKYYCHSCHGAAGQGVCDLRNAFTHYKDKPGVVAFIHNASKFVPDTKMPTWEGVILEEEYEPLSEYVRHLGSQPRAEAKGP